jgi:hypothetical protein
MPDIGIWNEEHQRIDFNYEAWERYTTRRFLEYPTNRHHARIEFTLFCPRDDLYDVPTHDWNPHHDIGNYHLTVHDCFYCSSQWSTIFDVVPAYLESGWDRRSTPSYTMIAEEGHQDPWGEEIIIASTSHDIYDNTSFRYAYFRDKWWKLSGFIRHWPPMWGIIWPEPDWIAPDEWLLPHGWAATPELSYPIPSRRVDWQRDGF